MKRTEEDIVLAAYDAYNARDADGIIEFVSDDVNWPNGDDRLHGKEALRKYWLDQWAQTATHDQPTEVSKLPDGRIKVCLDQVVRTLGGDEVSRGSFEYFFELRDDLIVRLDIAK